MFPTLLNVRGDQSYDKHDLKKENDGFGQDVLVSQNCKLGFRATPSLSTFPFLTRMNPFHLPEFPEQDVGWLTISIPNPCLLRI